jgi:tetratricopeptide (TPR) repeat protein
VKTGALKNLIDLLIRSGQYSRAEKHLIQLIDPTAESPENLKVLAFVLIKQEKYYEAIAVYERLFKIDPHDRETLKRLVGLYGKVGEIAKAQEIFRYLVQPA